MCVYENSDKYSMFASVRVTIELQASYINALTEVEKEGCSGKYTSTNEVGTVKTIVVYGRSVDLPEIFKNLEDSMIRGRAGDVFTTVFDYDEVKDITVELRDESDFEIGYNAETETLNAYKLYTSSETIFGGQD